MFGLINPLYKILGIFGVAAVLFGVGYYKGYSSEKARFNAFKAEIEASAKAQKQVNKQIEQKNKLIANNIKAEYETKINALRNYYAVGLRYPDAGKQLPRISAAASSSHAAASDPVFVGQCAETTLMLVSLQDWLRAVNEK